MTVMRGAGILAIGVAFMVGAVRLATASGSPAPARSLTPLPAEPRVPDPGPQDFERAQGAEGAQDIEGAGETEMEIFVDGDRRIFLPLESAFVLPDDSLEIRVTGVPTGTVELDIEGGSLAERGVGNWSWTPSFANGYADLRMTHAPTDTSWVIRAWRLVPMSEIRAGQIDGYRVGRYPDTPLGGNPIYLPPPGLVEVTDENRDVRVSPRFTIGQFRSKQSSSLPSFLILRTQLLLKLEVLLDALIDRGYPAESFHVMSGYRTPHYNVGVLGNARYSRHQWGGAADIFVDEAPTNGYMDDLDGDGRIGVRDIRVITSVVDSLERELETFPIGGAGVYRANSVRGPFVHLDVRGTRARW